MSKRFEDLQLLINQIKDLERQELEHHHLKSRDKLPANRLLILSRLQRAVMEIECIPQNRRLQPQEIAALEVESKNAEAQNIVLKEKTKAKILQALSSEWIRVEKNPDEKTLPKHLKMIWPEEVQKLSLKKNLESQAKKPVVTVVVNDSQAGLGLTRKEKELILKGAVIEAAEEIKKSLRFYEKSFLLGLLYEALFVTDLSQIPAEKKDTALAAWRNFRTRRDTLLSEIKTEHKLQPAANRDIAETMVHKRSENPKKFVERNKQLLKKEFETEFEKVLEDIKKFKKKAYKAEHLFKSETEVKQAPLPKIGLAHITKPSVTKNLLNLPKTCANPTISFFTFKHAIQISEQTLETPKNRRNSKS